DVLGLGVERLAELHDVDAVLAQRRTDRRTRVRLAGCDLQLDVRLEFLSHEDLCSGCKRLVSGSPAKTRDWGLGAGKIISSPEPLVPYVLTPSRADQIPIRPASPGRG